MNLLDGRLLLQIRCARPLSAFHGANEIHITLQRIQRQAGKSVVSRTTLRRRDGFEEKRVVLRCVITNPMTTLEILKAIPDEQEILYRRHLA
ncbi:MAG: hypothetical protein JRI76_06750 [Deltaproteobacteria bacterium]|nr:hypothetical protein [Deltaproteobacteria bacterium]MBW1954504.1 hypothetical protein [Deltaproteobacteria bacterium]MBW2041718.1 hypothetical protein [Deltaproteobacteria bacterium]MBW2131041.1 hypothetical protein [Deltaproteobacteria bacterium]